jgi:hypothetical protein
MFLCACDWIDWDLHQEASHTRQTNRTFDERMTSGLASEGDHYSTPVRPTPAYHYHVLSLTLAQTGAVYVFNLIVGAGALSLPHAFSESGFALGWWLGAQLMYI